MSLVIKDTDVPGTVTVSIAFVNAKGRPARVDGVPTWAASAPSLIDSLTPSADGMSATFHVADVIDASNLTVNADVDMGSGTKNVDFVDTVSVVPGDAVAATFTFGAVTPDGTGTPPTPIPDTFDNAGGTANADLTAAAQAYTGAEVVKLDGVVLPTAFTGTAAGELLYFTHLDQGGNIDKNGPTS